MFSWVCAPCCFRPETGTGNGDSPLPENDSMVGLVTQEPKPILKVKKTVIHDDKANSAEVATAS